MEKQSIYRILSYSDVGMVDFDKAWKAQHKIFSDRLANKINDTILLVEHPHTYTFGKSSDKNNLLLTKEELEDMSIPLYDIDRGGDVTYHGPGQIVGYPIINLSNWIKDTHKYLRALEEVIIKTLDEFDIKSNRIDKLTGVWVDDKKVCAIGIKITKWITMHGFSLNCNTDLNLFKSIIPCGITDKGVTSMQEVLGEKINLDLVKQKLVNNYKIIFNYDEIDSIDIVI